LPGLLFKFRQGVIIESGEVVVERFSPSDLNNIAVFTEQQLCRTQLPVIVESHGMAVGARVMDHDRIAGLQLGQQSVDGKLIVILAKRAGYVVQKGMRTVFLPQHRNMMIGAVKCRTHQVSHAGIQPGVFLVGFLDMKNPGHQKTVRTGNGTPRFEKDLQWSEPVANDQLVVQFSDPLADPDQVNRLMLILVRNADPAAQIRKFKANTCFPGDFDNQLKDNAGGLYKIIRVEFFEAPWYNP